MSIYTDYLNNHPDIDYKEFVKICAWNVKQLAPYKPAELETLPDSFPLNIGELNAQLDAAMDELQDLETMTPEQQTQLRDEAFDAIEDEHWSKIDELEQLITVYGAILSDLCRWNPTNSEMKTLKAFAIKELTSNMPNLQKYAISPVEPTVTSHVEGLRKIYNANITNLTKKITEESKNNAAANEYIALLNEQLNNAPDAEASNQSTLKINI